MLVKVALFDFDDTICHNDSIYRLLRYYIAKHPLSIFRFVLVGIRYIGYLLKLNSFEKVKSAMLFPLDKMSDQELERFFIKKVEPHYYPNIVNELQAKKDEGYIIIICTASCEAYMKYNRLPIDFLIGTKTNGSQIIGKNCKNERKVGLINDCLEKHNYQLDYEHSYAYSDSKNDMPMLNMVKNKMRVEKKTGKLTRW